MVKQNIRTLETGSNRRKTKTAQIMRHSEFVLPIVGTHSQGQ